MIGLALLLIAEAGLFAFAQAHDLIWLVLLLPWIFGDSLGAVVGSPGERS